MSIETVGLLASVMAVVMFFSPRDQIRNIIKIKKSDEVSPILFGVMIINCFLWTIYGLGINNWFIITPNAIGAVVGILTLAIILRYK
jgi:solute carrier family 50 (sugar transporter)